MSIFNSVSNLVVESAKFAKEYNEFRDAVNKHIYGEYSLPVKQFNTSVGIISWITLASDIKNKKGFKKAVINQTALTVMLVAHNAYYQYKANK